MLKGYTLPRTPEGTSSLAPMPPWHYVGTCLVVEYEADPQLALADVQWHKFGSNGDKDTITIGRVTLIVMRRSGVVRFDERR
jgi:hypothetical protein